MAIPRPDFICGSLVVCYLSHLIVQRTQKYFGFRQTRKAGLYRPQPFTFVTRYLCRFAPQSINRQPFTMRLATRIDSVSQRTAIYPSFSRPSIPHRSGCWQTIFDPVSLAFLITSRPLARHAGGGRASAVLFRRCSEVKSQS